MAMDVKGTLIEVLKIEEGTSKAGKEWKKRDFVIETNEQYPKKVCFTLFGDKISLIDPIPIQSEVTVYFNIESRDFNGKWYHNINCWKIDVEAKAQTAYDTGLIQKGENNLTEPTPPDENDLPF